MSQCTRNSASYHVFIDSLARKVASYDRNCLEPLQWLSQSLDGCRVWLECFTANDLSPFHYGFYKVFGDRQGLWEKFYQRVRRLISDP